MAARLLKIAVSLGLLGALAWVLDWEPVLATLARAEPGWVILAVALQGAVTVLATARWALLLRRDAPAYTLGRLVPLGFIAAFFNNLLPSATGGDLLRGYYVYRQSRSATLAVSPIVTERALGLAVMIGLATAALPFLDLTHPLLAGIADVLPGLLAAAAGGLLLAGLPAGYRPMHRFFARWADWKPVAGLLRITEACHHYFNRLSLVGALVVLSIALQGIEIVNFWLLGRAVGAELPLVTYFLIVPLVLVASALPVTVGGLGVREAAAISLLALVGMPEHQAAAVSLLFLVALVGSSLPGLYFFLTMKDHGRFLKQAERAEVV